MDGTRAGLTLFSSWGQRRSASLLKREAEESEGRCLAGKNNIDARHSMENEKQVVTPFSERSRKVPLGGGMSSNSRTTTRFAVRLRVAALS